jgi:hypothetical protein
METVTTFLTNWWGLVGVAVALVVGLIFYRKATIEMIKTLIFVAEEKARHGILTTGAEKKAWVIENGYQYLPAAVKTFISKQMFGILVQYVFDQLVKWAEKNQLR